MKLNRKKGYFSISAVAKMFSVHQQTVRLYEREGLITPKRSSGNTRLFSEEDVDRLEEVIYLTHELGINLAGVEMILKLKKQLRKMQDEMNKLFESTKDDLEKEKIQAEAIAHRAAKKISLLKANNLKEVGLIKKTTDTQQQTQDESDTWEIDYEE
jgi:MerR family transcriptional regulator/heat shock protein HspR